MGVRGKFHVQGVELLPGKDAGVKVKLTAVSRGDRNASWAAATPSGTIEMVVNNPKAADWYVEMIEVSRRTGKYPEVFVDMTASEDGYPGDGHKFRVADVPENHYLAGKCGECGLDKEGTASGGPTHPNG